MSDTTIRVEKDEVEFETPNDLTDSPQDASEAKRVGKFEKDVNFPKKQIYKKYKHRSEYSNPDGRPISNKEEFRDAQVKLVQDDET